jgi:hypothetical protein
MSAKARRAVKMGCASPATRRAGGKSVGVTAERPLQAAGEPDVRANKSGSTCNRVAPDGAANRGSLARRAVAERVYEALTQPDWNGQFEWERWRWGDPMMNRDDIVAAIERAIGEADEPRKAATVPQTRRRK